jgi:hypothetical protein
MNRLEITLIGLIAVAGPAFISGCSSAGSSNASSVSATTAPQLEDDFVPPSRGETQAQVIAQYDEPDRVLQSSVYGETWFYVFGKGKLFIPFYGPFAKLRFLTIHFDRYGRVIGWESGTNQPY